MAGGWTGLSLSLDFINQQYSMGAVWQKPPAKVFSDLITLTRSTGGGRINAAGLYEWVAASQPRFDYDPLTLVPLGLLIEEQRTNLALNSEVMGAGLNIVVGTDAIVAPNGLTTADLVREDTTNGEHMEFSVSASLTAGTTYTWSVFVKAGPGTDNRACIRTSGTGNNFSLSFRFDTETITPATGSPTGYFEKLPNGWYRIGMTFTAGGTNTASLRLQLQRGGVLSYLGDGSSGIYYWGRQFEVGSWWTSYIPTAGAQVTRAADAVSVNSLSPWYRQGEGTFVVKGDLRSRAGNTKVSLDIGAGGAFGTTAYIAHTAGSLDLLSPDTAPLTLNSGGSNTTTTFRCAAALRANDSTMAVKGVVGGLDTTCALPSAPTALFLGKGGWAGASSYLNGHLRSVAYYPRRLPNTDLQALTAA